MKNKHLIKKVLPYFYKYRFTLFLDYITKSEKTDEKVLVSSFNCHPSTAHIQFMKTWEDNDTKGTVLARHLIQFVYLNKPIQTNLI